LGSDPIVRVSVAHGEPRVVVHNVLFQRVVLFDESLL
jgi:hypothetical protein